MSGLEQGSSLGGYRILARLRAGAMGVLYLARRQGPGGFARPVAIKVIHEHLAQNKRFTRMFIDEAKISSKIDDPNVVRVEEFGEENGRLYLVMEYVHGASLQQVLGMMRPRGGVPKEHAVAIAMQIAGGLHGAHEALDDDGTPLNIVHRDVSPHNVLVSYRGNVRVIDFGIAKARQVGGQTKTGSLRGKLAYMPPEQARSARTVDRRADLYCVGLVLWEMLTLRRLFDADSDIAILNQIREHKIVPPSAYVPGIPKSLDDVVLATLSQDPNGRPATGAILRKALGEAMPRALSILPADLGAMMGEIKEAALRDKREEADPAAQYGEELRRSHAIFTQSMGGGGSGSAEVEADVSPLSSSEPKTLDNKKKRPPPPDSETVALAAAPARPAPPALAVPASLLDASDTTGEQTRPGAPQRTRVMSGAVAGALPTPPPPRASTAPRPPMPSDPYLGHAPSAPGPPAPPPNQPPFMVWFHRWRDPIGFVGAGIAIGLAVAVLILVVTGDNAERRPSPPVSSRVDAGASATIAGRAMPPAPMIIAPPDPPPAPVESDPSASASAKKPTPKLH